MASHTIQAIKRNLKRGAETVTNKVTESLENKIKYLERQLARKMAGVTITLLGLIFLSLSVYFFLSETLQLEKATSFLIIAIILLVIGFFLRSTERRLYENEKL